MVQTLNTYAESDASPDADKLLSFCRYPGGAGELRVVEITTNHVLRLSGGKGLCKDLLLK
jgi:hypothetical protein